MARDGATFHLHDIPVTVDPSFFAVIGVFALAAPGLDALVLWVVIATVSVLVHELGHAVAFRAYGSEAAIRLHGMGGLTTGSRLPPARNLVVSLAGPLAGLLLLGVPALLLAGADLGGGDTWELALEYAILINVLWSLVNLLPVLPLDGGNVVESLLHLATGRDAERAARVISIVVATAGAYLAVRAGLFVAVLLAAFALAVNITALAQRRSDRVREQLAEAQLALVRRDPEAAVALADAVLAGAREVAERASAADVAVWARLIEGDPDAAGLALARRPDGVPVSACLQGALALGAHQPDRGVALLTFGLVSEPAGPEHLFATVVAARYGVLDALGEQLLELDGGRGLPAAGALAGLLHHQGFHREAATLAARLACDPRGDQQVWSYNTACSLARAGWTDDALAWLHAAVDHGWADRDRLVQDPDLAAVRARPAFALLHQRLVVAGEPGGSA